MAGFADDPRGAAIDQTVTDWPGVKARKVFGLRAWMRGGTMFGFLADTGAAVKLLPEVGRDEVLGREGVELFCYDGTPSKNWAVLPVTDDAELDSAITLLRTAYEAVAG